MKKFFSVILVLIASAVSAQTPRGVIERIAQEPSGLVIDTLIEHSLGVVVVKFKSSYYPVTVTVNGQDSFTFEASNGWHTFDVVPEYQNMAFRRTYTVYAESRMGNVHHPFTLTTPPKEVVLP